MSNDIAAPICDWTADWAIAPWVRTAKSYGKSTSLLPGPGDRTQDQLTEPGHDETKGRIQKKRIWAAKIVGVERLVLTIATSDSIDT